MRSWTPSIAAVVAAFCPVAKYAASVSRSTAARVSFSASSAELLDDERARQLLVLQPEREQSDVAVAGHQLRAHARDLVCAPRLVMGPAEPLDSFEHLADRDERPHAGVELVNGGERGVRNASPPSQPHTASGAPGTVRTEQPTSSAIATIACSGWVPSR